MSLHHLFSVFLAATLSLLTVGAHAQQTTPNKQLTLEQGKQKVFALWRRVEEHLKADKPAEALKVAQQALEIV